MKIARLETWNVSVPYLHDEISSRVARSGVTDTIVRLTADNGLVGWGIRKSGPDAASIEQAGQSARAPVRALAARRSSPACPWGSAAIRGIVKPSPAISLAPRKHSASQHSNAVP